MFNTALNVDWQDSFFKGRLTNAMVCHIMTEMSHPLSGSTLSPNLGSEFLPLLFAFLLEEHGSYTLSRLVSLVISLVTNEVELFGTNAMNCIAFIRRIFR